MATELGSYVNEVFGAKEAIDAEKNNELVLFVAPLGQAVPEDGIFDYTTLDSLSDVGPIAPRSVVLFREDQAEMLQVLCRNASAFARTLFPIYGAPECRYAPWFDEATFGLERISYGPYVSELRAAAEVKEQLAARDKSGTDVERDRYTKKNGEVRFADISDGNEDGADDASLEG